MANIPVPWDALHSGQAALYLADFDTIQTCVTSGDLDANRCSDDDARLLFEMIIESQKHGLRRMDFLITDTVRDLLIMEHGLDDDEVMQEFDDDARKFLEEGSDDEFDEGDHGDQTANKSKSSAARAIITSTTNKPLPKGPAKSKPAQGSTANAKKSKSGVTDPPTVSMRPKDTANASLATGSNTKAKASKPSAVGAVVTSTANELPPKDSTKSKPAIVGPTVKANGSKSSAAGAVVRPTTNKLPPKDSVKSKLVQGSTAKAKKSKSGVTDPPTTTTTSTMSDAGSAAAGVAAPGKKKRGRVAGDGDDVLGAPKPVVKRARISWQDVVPQRETSRR